MATSATTSILLGMVVSEGKILVAAALVLVFLELAVFLRKLFK